MIYTKDELSIMLDDFLSNSENTLERWQEYLILAFVDNVQKQLLQQHHVSLSLPLAELGDFVDWIREMNFKKYADGWCEAGGSNGWHCTTDELLKMFRNRGNAS